MQNFFLAGTRSRIDKIVVSFRELYEILKSRVTPTITINAINRYRRGPKTCPQAKTSKSGHAIFSLFSRRVRAMSMTQRRVENTRVYFGRFRLYRLT